MVAPLGVVMVEVEVGHLTLMPFWAQPDRVAAVAAPLVGVLLLAIQLL